MDIASVALKRYSIKAFDPSKRLTAEQAEKLKTLLQFSLSSTNSQPWHSIIVGTDEGKAYVAKSAAGGFVFGKRKTLDAFHIVVFYTKTATDDTWLEHVVDQKEGDGCFAMLEAKATNHKGRTFFVDMHRKELEDGSRWMAEQVYLNVGSFLLGVTAMDLDAVSIGSFGPAIVGARFGLKEKGFISVVVVLMGHHGVEDFNATLSESRLPLETTLTEV